VREKESPVKKGDGANYLLSVILAIGLYRPKDNPDMEGKVKKISMGGEDSGRGGIVDKHDYRNSKKNWD